MGKTLLGSLLAAVVLMVWGFVTWAVLSDQLGIVKPLPDEAAVADALREHAPDDGVYFFPVEGFMGSEAERAAWAERHARGPVGLLFLRSGGVEPAMGRQLFLGFVHFFVSALLAAVILSVAWLRGYWQRVQLATLLGLFAGFVVAVSNSVWWYVPIGFTLYSLIVLVLGWFLAGLVLARFVRPPVRATGASG